GDRAPPRERSPRLVAATRGERRGPKPTDGRGGARRGSRRGRFRRGPAVRPEADPRRELELRRRILEQELHGLRDEVESTGGRAPAGGWGVAAARLRRGNQPRPPLRDSPEAKEAHYGSALALTCRKPRGGPRGPRKAGTRTAGPATRSQRMTTRSPRFTFHA